MHVLYLPITSQPRELESKLLLGLVARERGLKPVIGYKSSLLHRLHKLERGTFLTHNARQKATKLAALKKFGHRIVVLDEEALVRQTDEIFIKKHPKGAFDHVDQILCWGEDDAQMWQRFGISVREGIAVVGNPRMDLLRKEFAPRQNAAVDTLKRRYGRFVLLNTNFPTVNNLTPQGGGLRMAHWAMDTGGRETTDQFLLHKRRMLEAELAVVPEIAKFIAPTTLVIRPHPNEDHAPWLKAARGLQNVKVVFDGGVIPWLIAAEALIHNGCTTGVEMAVAGRPVINFVPLQSKYDNPLAHAFGTTCKNLDQLKTAIRQALEGNQFALSHEQEARLQHHVANYKGPLSCDRIVNAILQGQISKSPTTHSTRLLYHAERLGTRLSTWLKLNATPKGREKIQLLQKLFPSLSPGDFDAEQLNSSTEQLELLARQFPPLKQSELDSTLNAFTDSTGQFGQRRIRMLSHFHFTID